MQMKEKHIVGCVLGTAVGDALGLPYEGLPRSRAAKILGCPSRHRFFFGRGMISDDTEHTLMVVQSLIVSSNDEDIFRRALGRRLRFWLATIPAGVGLATLRSIIRMWCGVSPHRSGVFSAGNGPAMRSAILGAALKHRGKMCQLVRASARITHSDPKAEWGALAVALAAQMARQHASVDPEDFRDQLQLLLEEESVEFLGLISAVAVSVNNGDSTKSFASSIGLGRGVSGYVFHSVPVAIHAWLAHQGDFREAVTAVIECGGDADSNAAIVGGIIGSSCGTEGIPPEWISGLADWPCTVGYMARLGRQLSESLESGRPLRPVQQPFVLMLSRNLFFLLVVLFHGFRRLLPPY